MKKLILIGSGGHANSVYDVILSEKNFSIEKVIDKSSTRKFFKEFQVNNQKKFLSNNKAKKNIHLSFGSIYDLNIRLRLFKTLKKKKIYNFPIIISPRSYVSKSALIQEGSIIMHDVIVNSGVKISNNVVVNTKALIEHDVIIGDNSHISTGVIINGNVKIGKNCFVGSGSVIRENLEIPDNTFIKIGSIIKK
jgi:sugar O-acyltransferase (sialic acid O-acetyltransferase NeuD family)